MSKISDTDYFKAKEIVKEYETHYFLQIRDGKHPQFYFNEEKEEVTCRCGKKAIQIRKTDLFLCSAFTVYTCDFSK